MSGVQAAVAPPRTPFTLLAGCLSMLALGVNGTAIMAALPTMRHDLGLNPAQVEWAINAYLVVSAACIIPGGKACDWLGARLVSVVGLALFAFASVIVATGQVPAAILAGRALQGLAAALAVPGTLAVVSEASSLERRASAISAWAGFVMLGFSLGPLIGGTLTHYLDWRVIFWASGGSMLVAAAGFAGMGPAATARSRAGRHFDAAGFALLAIGMTALVSTLHALPTTATCSRALSRPGRGGGRRLRDAPQARAPRAGSAHRLGPAQADDLRPRCCPGLDRHVLHPGSAAVLQSIRTEPGGAEVDAGRRRSLAAAYERRAPAFRVLRALARPAVRRAQDPYRRQFADCGRGHAHRGCRGAQALDPTDHRSLRHRRWLGRALCNGTQACTGDAAGQSGGGGLRHYQCLYFLGGSIGVAAGAVAFALGGLPGAMAMIVALALVGAVLCRGLAREL